MNNKFIIKNFRVFDNSETSFLLKPITLLTGCNSSGKSSLVKALLLLSDFFEQVKDDLNKNDDCSLQSHKLDFTKKQHQNLGNFNKVLNNQSGEEDKITFSYQIESLLLAENITVELSFKASEKDELNNGWLTNIIIKKENGEIFYSATINVEEGKLEVQHVNMNILKDNFMRFATASSAYSTVDEIKMCSILGPQIGLTKEELIERAKEIKTFSIYEQLSQYKKNSFLRWHEKSSTLKGKNNKFIHSNHWDWIKSAHHYNTLFIMPVFEWIENTPKMDVRKVIDEKLKGVEKIDEGMLYNLNRLLTEFEQSDYNSFIDYFNAKEDKDLIFTLENQRSEFFEGPKQLLVKSLKHSSLDHYITDNLHPKNFISLDNESNDNDTIDKFKNREIDFKFVYSTLLDICIATVDGFEKFLNFDPSVDIAYTHPFYNLFQYYLLFILREAITPEFLNDIKYVGSTRATVQRLYTFDSQGTDFNELLLKYFDAKKNYKGTDYTPDTFMNHWIKKFEIGDSLKLKSTEEGLGVMLYLYKDNDKNRRLLAEEGYGITQLVSLILQIETSILEAKTIFKYEDNDDPLNTILNRKTFKEYEQSILTIEEPEIHLHPKLQSLLADMFLHAYNKYNIHFVVETHSEYLIRKTQVLVKNENYSTNEEAEQSTPFITYYLPAKGKPYSLRYRKDGKFAEKFGEGFYDEAASLTFEIL